MSWPALLLSLSSPSIRPLSRQSPEELAWLQPLLQQLQEAKVEVTVQPSPQQPTMAAMEGLLTYVQETSFPAIDRVEIPHRDLRKAR